MIVSRLEKLLIERSLVSKEQLELAKKEQQRTGEKLTDVLIRLGFISEEELTKIQAEITGIPYVSLKDYEFSKELAEIIPEDFARAYKLVPLKKENSRLTVAMANFLDYHVIDRLTQKTRCLINVVAATESDIESAIEKIYRGVTFSDLLDESNNFETLTGVEVVEEAPVVKIVNYLITQAVRREATDLHFEPEEKIVRTRFRQDGILIPGPTLPKHLQSAITSRIKIMAKMNISETRLPQDGRIDFKMGKKDVDIRVSTFPTLWGESIVLRILDREKMILGLEKLGLTSENLEIYRKYINKANGIILVTGPTGSGKTTTLYSTLMEINSIEKKIITLEDPIEYHFPMINQSQINVKAGLTFATGLRAIFRQDPDIILVGEMRDYETIEMAIRASLTGHLVFSTVHTNDAASTISRLLDMKVEPYLITSTVLIIVAQRLVRLLCEKCKEKIETPDLVKIECEKMGIEPPEYIYQAKGCKLCNGVGYKGRTGIFEILVISPEVSSLILKRAPSSQIKEVAMKEGMKTMFQDGILKVIKGRTTISEIIRVTNM